MKKLQVFIETVKTIIDPIFSICVMVLKLSKGTGFASTDSKRILKCQEYWKNSRNCLKLLLSDYKHLTLKEGDHGQILASLLENLRYMEESMNLLFLELLTMADLEEVSLNDSSIVDSTSLKNVTAMNVLLRIKSKLEGRTMEKRLAVNDQVDELIKSAISLENLSQLYEGWMSWI